MGVGMSEQKRVIDLVESRGEFLKLEDGFLYFDPRGSGALAAHHLRWIADELDRRNAGHQKKLDEYFSSRDPIEPACVTESVFNNSRR